MRGAETWGFREYPFFSGIRQSIWVLTWGERIVPTTMNCHVGIVIMFGSFLSHRKTLDFGGWKGGQNRFPPAKMLARVKKFSCYRHREATNLFRETFLRRNRFWRELEKKQHWHDFRLSWNREMKEVFFLIRESNARWLVFFLLFVGNY